MASLSTEGFAELIAGFRAAGYRFRGFSEPAEARTVVLRHDIDFSVDLAHALAKEEAELGVNATFFFMATSNAYNLFSAHNRRLVREIIAMGHTASLHFDPTVHEDVDAGFREECAALAPLTGPVEIVSLHRPGDYLLDNNRPLPGARHTYEDCYFRDLAYISDSGGAFAHGHPFETDAFASGRPIQLLLHPIWWTAAGTCCSDKVRQWQADHLDFITREMVANCKTFDGRSILTPAYEAAA